MSSDSKFPWRRYATILGMASEHTSMKYRFQPPDCKGAGENGESASPHERTSESHDNAEHAVFELLKGLGEDLDLTTYDEHIVFATEQALRNWRLPVVEKHGERRVDIFCDQANSDQRVTGRVVITPHGETEDEVRELVGQMVNELMKPSGNGASKITLAIHVTHGMRTQQLMLQHAAMYLDTLGLVNWKHAWYAYRPPREDDDDQSRSGPRQAPVGRLQDLAPMLRSMRQASAIQSLRAGLYTAPFDEEIKLLKDGCPEETIVKAIRGLLLSVRTNDLEMAKQNADSLQKQQTTIESLPLHRAGVQSLRTVLETLNALTNDTPSADKQFTLAKIALRAGLLASALQVAVEAFVTRVQGILEPRAESTPDPNGEKAKGAREFRQRVTGALIYGKKSRGIGDDSRIQPLAEKSVQESDMIKEFHTLNKARNPVTHGFVAQSKEDICAARDLLGTNVSSPGQPGERLKKLVEFLSAAQVENVLRSPEGKEQPR